MKNGQVGASLGGRIELSPKRKARRAKKRRAEEKRWASMAGPITIKNVKE